MHLSPLLRSVRSGKALAGEPAGLGRAPHRETPSQSPRLVVRVLIAHEDTRIRDAYRRILLETDVNHDIAAFRELRSRAAHTAESVYSRASSCSAAITCTGDVARLGGDEFTALLPDIRNSRDAAPVAERLIAAIRRPVRIAGSWIAATPSVGIAIYPKDGANGETLLRNADAAMYVAKDQRPGTYSFFDPATNHTALRASECSPFTHCMSI